MTEAVFYWHCCRLGLTLKQTSVAATFCTAMGTKFDKFVQQMDENLSLLNKFKVLSE